MYQVSGDRGHDGDYVDRRGGGRGGGSRGGRSGGGGGRGSRGKANVGYLNPAAPSFIQRLRAEHGLKSSEESHAEQMAMKRQSASSDPDAPTVVTPQDLDTRPVMPDEAPQVVVYVNFSICVRMRRPGYKRPVCSRLSPDVFLIQS